MFCVYGWDKIHNGWATALYVVKNFSNVEQKWQSQDQKKKFFSLYYGCPINYEWWWSSSLSSDKNFDFQTKQNKKKFHCFFHSKKIFLDLLSWPPVISDGIFFLGFSREMCERKIFHYNIKLSLTFNMNDNWPCHKKNINISCAYEINIISSSFLNDSQSYSSSSIH